MIALTLHWNNAKQILKMNDGTESCPLAYSVTFYK